MPPVRARRDDRSKDGGSLMSMQTGQDHSGFFLQRCRPDDPAAVGLGYRACRGLGLRLVTRLPLPGVLPPYRMHTSKIRTCDA